MNAPTFTERAAQQVRPDAEVSGGIAFDTSTEAGGKGTLGFLNALCGGGTAEERRERHLNGARQAIRSAQALIAINPDSPACVGLRMVIERNERLLALAQREVA